MITELILTAPQDLAIGTLLFSQTDNVTDEWIAGVHNSRRTFTNLLPASCAVQITPTGKASQTVLFTLHPGENSLTLPDYALLAAAGGNLHQLDNQGALQPWTTNIQGSVGWLTALPGATWQMHDDTDSNADTNSENVAPNTPLSIGGGDQLRQLIRHRQAEPSLPLPVRKISIGLSQSPVHHPFAYRPYDSLTDARYKNGRLEMVLSPSPDENLRIRLDLATEGLPERYSLLPLYREGLQVSIQTAPFFASELQVTLLPVNPFLQAVTRVLQSGSIREARALQTAGDSLNDALRGDPWAVLITCLLYLRYPEVCSEQRLATLAEDLTPLAWLHDCRVVLAAVALQQTGQQQSGQPEQFLRQQSAAVSQALEHLWQALKSSSPCFSYSNQVFGQLLDSIDNWMAYHSPRLPRKIMAHFGKVQSQWQQKQVMQRSSGLSYSWSNIRSGNSEGRLRRKYSKNLFSGQIEAGRIALKMQRTDVAHDEELKRRMMEIIQQRSRHINKRPALARPASATGHLVAQIAQGEFSLSAYWLSPASDKRKRVKLVVTCNGENPLSTVSEVKFGLHHKDFIDKVSVPVKRGRAELAVMIKQPLTVRAELMPVGVVLELALELTERARPGRLLKR